MRELWRTFVSERKSSAWFNFEQIEFPVCATISSEPFFKTAPISTQTPQQTISNYPIQTKLNERLVKEVIFRPHAVPITNIAIGPSGNLEATMRDVRIARDKISVVPSLPERRRQHHGGAWIRSSGICIHLHCRRQQHKIPYLLPLPRNHHGHCGKHAVLK